MHWGLANAVHWNPVPRSVSVCSMLLHGEPEGAPPLSPVVCVREQGSPPMCPPLTEKRPKACQNKTEKKSAWDFCRFFFKVKAFRLSDTIFL
jgi:hypothetical protein